MADPDADLQRWFDNLPKKVRRPLSAKLKEQADRLSAAQKSKLQSLEQAPQDSGDLEKSCQVIDGRNDLEFFVVAGGELTTKEVRTGSGQSYDYSLAFEFGNENQPARPFFFSTYAEMRDDIQEEISGTAEEVIAKA